MFLIPKDSLLRDELHLRLDRLIGRQADWADICAVLSEFGYESITAEDLDDIYGSY